MDVDDKFPFTGAIVAISNVPLRSDPLARALGSRVVVLEHEPTDDELAAFIRKLARDRFKELSPEECADTAEFVISETRAFDLRLDLRHFSKALQDRRQFQSGKAKTDWRDLVRSSLRKPIEAGAHPLSKREEIERDRQTVLSVMAKYPGDTDEQLKASGLRKSTFYARRREVQA